MPKSLREALSNDDIRAQLRPLVDELVGGETDGRWVWIRDVFPDPTVLVYEVSGEEAENPGMFQVGYTIDAETDVVALEGDPFEVISSTVYVRKPDADTAPTTTTTPVTDTTTTEADEARRDRDRDLMIGDCIPLVESTLRDDGTVTVKLIEDGWSGNGKYYGQAVLERDAPDAFPAGTQMYWDHPSISEAHDRPERSLRDLAAVTVSDARWDDNGPAGPGVYADTHVFEAWQPHVEELAPHIGVSIRAGGQTHFGEADGQTGEIVERIVFGRSVDFVTTAAAGGEIVQLFEAARGSGPSPKPPKKEPPVPPTNLEEVQRLQTELSEAQALGTLAAADRDRFREQLVLREARDHVALALVEAEIPDITKARLVDQLAGPQASLPLTEAKTLDRDELSKLVESAVTGEREYLATLSGTGRVHGLGPSSGGGETDATEATSRLEESFRQIGLSDEAAKTAAAGRG